jgi:transposase
MPFRETTVNDERIRFVIQASQSKANKKFLCEVFGITRRTGDKWLGRYHAAGSLVGVQEQSRRPRHSPTETPPELVERIVAFRR